MPVGFSVLHCDGELKIDFSLPPLVAGEALLTSDKEGQVTALLFGRIYYRRELLACLPEHAVARTKNASDATLALTVYQHGGPDSLERLEGSFALVIADMAAHRILAMRDPMGGYPLYWSRSGTAVMLSTNQAALLNWLGYRVLDRDYLADYFLTQGSVSELASESCVWQGIHRLPPGSILTVDTTTGQVRQRVYWHWLERLVDPGSDHLASIADAFADLLTKAIQERARGPTVAHLSGGMDSTAVALLAASVTGEAKNRFRTLSLVYERLTQLARETPYIEVATRQLDGSIPHRLVADDILDFDIFADPPRHEEPYPGLSRLGMDRATVDAAADLGGATLLTGIGADEILDRLPYHLTDWLRRGRWWTAWRESCRWAYAYQWSPWQVLYPFGVCNLFPGWARLGWGRWFRTRAGLSLENEWLLPPWLRSSFVRRYALQERARDAVKRIYSFCRPTSLSVALSSIIDRRGDAISWAIAAPRGLAIAHPFLDPRVVCFGLGLHARLLPEPGRLKPVLVQAMRDVLPETIRTRRSKGHFNELYYLGLARNLPALERLIRDSPCDDLDLLDRDLLTQQLRKAALGGTGARPLQHLNLMLALLKWLAMQDDFSNESEKSK